MNSSTGEFMNRPLISGGQWDGSVVGKVMDSLRSGETHYVEVPGHAGLRERIRGYLTSTGIAKGGQVLVTAGIQEARFLSVQALGKVLGKVAFPRVLHPGVREVLALRDLDCVFLEVGTDQRMLAPPAALGKLPGGVKVLYIESPSRFTGACYEKQELEEILGFCREQEVSIIVDSGLHAWAEGPCDSSAAGLQIDDSTFMIGEAWPGSGIDELHIGYVLASEEMVKKIAVQKQVISICTSAPSQNAAIAVAGDYRKRHVQTVANLKQTRVALESRLKDTGAEIVSSPVVNFIVCKANPAVRRKLEAAKMSYTDSSCFGEPGLMQLPVSEQSIEALR